MGDTSGPALCIGESLVDLICERPVGSFEEADAFGPHLGGAATNVAVHAAREGAPVALAAGAGDDPWGRWLHRRLGKERVDLRSWPLLAGQTTAVAFAVLDEDARALSRWLAARTCSSTGTCACTAGATPPKPPTSHG
jgi:sugar/nucleoside kinase (ribokinase family)